MAGPLAQAPEQSHVSLLELCHMISHMSDRNRTETLGKRQVFSKLDMHASAVVIFHFFKFKGCVRSLLCCRWLNPAIFVLAAAFDSLDHEASRLSAWKARAVHQEQIHWSDVEQEAQPGLRGAKSWARKIWRFHGWAWR